MSELGLTKKDWNQLMLNILSNIEYLEQGESGGSQVREGKKIERIVRKMEPYLDTKSKSLIKKFLD
jgi:hypothetical protein